MLRLDPAARPLWRTPDRMDLGLDPVLARLDPVPPGAEHVVHALTVGIDRAGLEALAAASGVEDLDGLLDRLAPALLPRAAPEPPPVRIAIDAPADLVALLDPWLAPAASGTPDVVVVAAHHVIPPAATVRRLADDLPHVGLVFGDQSALVGPVVVPGVTPCLRCADEHRLEDPTWRAVAAQLLRRTTSRTATSLRTRLAAVAALGDVLESLRTGDPTGLEGHAVRIGADGAVSRLPRPWHEACWCRSPSPARTGSATDGAPPAGARASAPTTAAGGPAPA